MRSSTATTWCSSDETVRGLGLRPGCRGAGPVCADPDVAPAGSDSDSGRVVRASLVHTTGAAGLGALAAGAPGRRRASIADPKDPDRRRHRRGAGRADDARVVVRAAGDRRQPGSGSWGGQTDGDERQRLRGPRRRSGTRRHGAARGCRPAGAPGGHPAAPRAAGRSRARRPAAGAGRGAGLHGGGDDDPGQPAAHRARPAAHHLPGLAGDLRRTDGARCAPGRTRRPDRLERRPPRDPRRRPRPTTPT